MLGVLRQRSMHGYEVRQTLENWGAEFWAGVTYGSIYFALKKMADEGLVEAVGTKRQGSRPERTIYAITQRGDEEFMRLLRELWFSYRPPFDPFTVAWTFLPALPREEALSALRARIAGFRQALEKSAYYTELKRQHAGEHVADSLRRSYAKDEVELRWLEEMIKKIESGGLP